MTTFSKSFFSNKVQEIYTNLDGVVTNSSDTIFILKKGNKIFDFHPFFESLENELKHGKENHLAFPCVQLIDTKSEVICDITIKKENDFLAILLFDYSKHYEHLYDAQQEKKTAMLNEQAYELKTKYLEEKTALLEFIQNQINNNVVQETEEVIIELEKLKKTKLTKQQDSITNSIKKKLVSLRANALQISENLYH